MAVFRESAMARTFCAELGEADEVAVAPLVVGACSESLMLVLYLSDTMFRYAIVIPFLLRALRSKQYWKERSEYKNITM